MDAIGYFLFVYLAPSGLLSVGLIGLACEMRTVRTALASRHWPQTAGIIRVAEIVGAVDAPEPEGVGISARPWRYLTTWWAEKASPVGGSF